MSDRFYLNNDWLFCENFEDMSDPSKEKVTVSIPHTVKETPLNYFDEHIYQMVSGYKKTIGVLPEWKDKSVRLTFEGVAHEATVYINGKEKLIHKCGYTAFTIDISDETKESENVEILVRVDSNETIDQPPFGYVIDYMTYGGIYRDVYVDVSDKTYIEDAFLYTEFKDKKPYLTGEVKVKNNDKRDLALIISVNGIKAEIPVNGNTFKFSTDPGEVTLWSIENPVLYDASLKLTEKNGKLIDEYIVRTGFRKSEFKKDGYYLNDKKIKLRGLNRHQSFPYTGYAMPDSVQEADAYIIKKELGLNAVRTSHYPQSQAFIDKCDELGILVFTEIPGWQHIGGVEWKAQAVENVKDMVLQYRNHPSIILWGVRINESHDDHSFYENTNKTAHLYDPTRPTGGVRALKKSELLEDVYTYNDFLHDGKSKGCDKKKSVTSDVEKPYLISEYNGHMYPTKSFDKEAVRREQAIRHANVLDAVAGEEDIAGAFGWCMFDYNTHKDFGSGDRICYHGVMDMFRNPKLASFVYSCENSDPEAEIILQLSSSMDIGEHPGCNREKTWIFTNADSVKMYKNERLLKEYFPKDSTYKNLKHGPILIDDFVGNAIDEGEAYSKSLSRDIKKMMNATALYGLSNLPKSIYLLAAKAVLFHHMKMEDAVRLYNKYIGDWGGTSTVYKFEAIKNGQVVKTITKEPATEVRLEALITDDTLRPGKSYDIKEIRLRATDQNGNTLPFFNEPVLIACEGPAEIIGLHTVSLKGGMGGTYIRTTGFENGNVKVTFNTAQSKETVVNLKIEREDKWNVLK